MSSPIAPLALADLALATGGRITPRHTSRDEILVAKPFTAPPMPSPFAPRPAPVTPEQLLEAMRPQPPKAAPSEAPKP